MQEKTKVAIAWAIIVPLCATLLLGGWWFCRDPIAAEHEKSHLLLQTLQPHEVDRRATVPPMGEPIAVTTVSVMGDVTIEAEPGEPGEMVSVATATEPVGWMVIRAQPFELLNPAISPDAKTARIVVTDPGTYLWLAFPEGSPPQPIAETVILGGDPEPEPDPGPDPPDPDPPTPADVAWLVIIEETGDRTAEEGAILASETLRSYLRDHDIQWWFTDDDATDENGDPIPQLEKYKRETSDLDLPVVLTLDASGNVIRKQELPATVDEVLELLK